MKPYTHCSFCGIRFSPHLPFPRRCVRCDNMTYVNPIPVSVLLQPVGKGLLTIRRGVAPRMGQLALPGGYIDMRESWQQAGARELWEETGLRVDVASIRHFATHSAPDGTVLIFGVAEEIEVGKMPAFSPTNETTQRLIITQPQPLAFPLHTQVVEEWFRRQVG